MLNYVRFAETFPDIQIVSRLSDELSLDHFLTIADLDDDMHRIFYSEKCFAEKWSLEQLKNSIKSKLLSRITVKSSFDRTVVTLVSNSLLKKSPPPPPGPKTGGLFLT